MPYPCLVRWPALILAATLLTCGGDDDGDTGDDPEGEAYACVQLPRPASSDIVALTRVYPQVAVEGAIDLALVPGGARWLYLVKSGLVYSFSVDGPAPPVLALDLRAQVIEDGEAGLLGVAVHPDFEVNGEVFLSYTTPGGDAFLSRVSRFRSVDGGVTLDPSSEEVILEVSQPYTNHNGGDIDFGPDGYLYWGLGDGGSGGDPLGNGQDPSTLLGAMLRIDVDGGSPYAIPEDNPFADGGGAPEVYAWGFRNPWRFSFDRETGALWTGDVGQNVWEEVDRVVLGGNYGWSVKEGDACFNQDSCDDAGLIDPVAQYRNTSSASVVGGAVYRGAALPELVGQYLYSDFYQGTLWAVVEGQAPTQVSAAGARSITAYAEGEDGELYAVRYDGAILRLEAAPPHEGEALPERLSATGCVDVAAPDDPGALHRYQLNVPFWSDGAEKDRWLSLPAGSTILPADDGDFELPPGAVVVKSFRLGGRLVETRLMVRHDDGAWAGYSYAWDEDGGDATLLAGGELRDIDGQAWSFPSPGDCLYCHTEAAGRTLGLERRQLARLVDDGGGGSVDQLSRFVELGLLLVDPGGEALPELDGGAALEERARAYLHANCSQCHRPDGPDGRANFDARYTTPLAETGMCDQPPRAGALEITDARVIAPGDPARSVLLARMRSLGPTRMPIIGSARVDEEGAALVDAWIAGLAVCP
ncbi:MAG: PQQ-dependent sugar dehydrogenase [Nannocystaceae bacterium]